MTEKEVEQRMEHKAGRVMGGQQREEGVELKLIRMESSGAPK